MNIPCNAPGIGGPADAPEYEGPSPAELAKQKLGDLNWLDIWKNDFVTRDVLSMIFLADEDFLAAIHRMRYEASRLAEAEATKEYEDNVRAWENSLRDPSNGDMDMEAAA